MPTRDAKRGSIPLVLTMKKKVYVAGGSSEREIVRFWIQALKAAGVEITHDWTSCEGFDRPSTEEERVKWAAEDLEGVKEADVIWWLCPIEKSEGASFESGFAFGLGKRIVVSGSNALCLPRIFPLLLLGRFEMHSEAFTWVVQHCGV